MNEARQVFDAHLQKYSDLTIEDKRVLGRVLIDMERAEEALKLMTPMHNADPDDEVITTLLVSAKVRMNMRIEALAIIEEAAQRSFRDKGLWLELGTELYQEYANPEAALTLRNICRQDPDYRRAKLALARTYLRLNEVEEARQLLGEFQGDLSEGQVSTAVIDYHTVVGEYSQAISLAKLRLRDNPQDVEAGILLGNAYHAVRNFALAEASYNAALQDVSADGEELRRELLQLIAKNAFYGQKFDQAILILRQLLDERPTDFASRILLIETLIKTRCFEAAEELTRGTGDLNPRQHFDLNVQWGYVLLKQGRNGEAANEFELLAANPNGHLPDVAYGLYRAGKSLSQPQVIRQALALGPSALAPAALWAIGFADRAMTNCDCRSAAAVLDDALIVEPKNVVLLIHRGEAEQLCDCSCHGPCDRPFPKLFTAGHEDCCGTSRPAEAWFRSALQISPTNIRARLGLARVLIKHLEYGPGNAEFKSLLEFLPHDANIIRETARVVEGESGIESAAGIYVKGQQLVAQEDPPGDPMAVPAGGFGAARLAGPVPGEVNAVPASALLATELRAKYLRGWRFQEAIPIYQSLIEAEPTNEAALFDLAQSQSALNRTQCAIDAYQQLLEVNPCHRDAATALCATSSNYAQR